MAGYLTIREKQIPGNFIGDGSAGDLDGACCIDDNGKGLYSACLDSGDALHVTDPDPEHPGLEV